MAISTPDDDGTFGAAVLIGAQYRAATDGSQARSGVELVATAPTPGFGAGASAWRRCGVVAWSPYLWATGPTADMTMPTGLRSA